MHTVHVSFHKDETVRLLIICGTLRCITHLWGVVDFYPIFLFVVFKFGGQNCFSSHGLVKNGGATTRTCSLSRRCSANISNRNTSRRLIGWRSHAFLRDVVTHWTGGAHTLRLCKWHKLLRLLYYHFNFIITKAQSTKILSKTTQSIEACKSGHISFGIECVHVTSSNSQIQN